jgi:iron complex transport system substrate-binding protein
MRSYSGLVVAMLALLVVGCGKKAAAPLPEAPRIYKRIVSLNPGLTEIVAMRIDLTKLVGRTASCNYPTAIEKVPIVMTKEKPDYEKLALQKPDLIVFDALLFNESDIARLKELRCDLFGLKARTVDEYCRSLYELGAITKSEANISEYVDRIRQSEAFASARSENERPTVAVLMPGNGSEHFVAGVDSFQADVVKVSGGKPVGPKADRFVPMDVESFVQLNPDFIIVAGDAASVISDPRLQSMKAIKETIKAPGVADTRVLPLHPDILLRIGDRLDKLIDALAHRF